MTISSSFWEKQMIRGVKNSWLLAVIGFYLASYFIYVLTLTFNELAYEKRTFGELLSRYAFSQAFDYAFKFLLTVPLCYLYFRLLAHWQPLYKLVLHVLTLVLFVFTWKAVFYFTMESLERGHLRGSSEIWDIYIPALFYVIQFGLFHAFEYYYQLQKQKEVAFQLQKMSLQSELSALKAQLNPHFLYNVFNTISASVPPEHEHTRELIAELADLFRYQLKASRTELVPLSDEIEFITKYLHLEKARFGDRLTIKMDISDAILSEKVPSMILQPLVENSLKHGLASLIEGGEVSISIKKTVNALQFEIRDTGIGVKNKAELLKNQGIGIKNTQLRLEKMYGSTLQFSDNSPSGLIVYFEIKDPSVS